MPNDNFYHSDRPDWLQYFLTNWLKNKHSSKMSYLEGWQGDPNDINYDMEKPFLYKDFPGQTAINWDDVGPAGARWHGSDRGPFGGLAGDPIKTPWSPEWLGYWDEETARNESIKQFLQNILNQ